MKKSITYFLRIVFLLFLCALRVSAQETYMPLDPEKYHLFDRMDILSGRKSSLGHSAYKPFYRPDTKALSDSSLSNYKKVSKVDSFQVQYLKNDQWALYDDSTAGNSKKPFLKLFYKKKNSIISVKNKDFKLQVSPVLYLHGGKQSDNTNNLYINSRGVEVRGSIDRKVGFYFFATDNQAAFQDYAMQRTVLPGFPDPVVAGEGFAKPFKKNAVDFITARGYITFDVTKHINVQFGHDKNFIGNGYRSLFLSDFSAPYTFLKLTTNIWKIKYTNLFAELNAGYVNGRRFNSKILTLHHLSMNILPNLNIGLFESIMYGPKDTTNSTNTRLQIDYMNPIIFLRYSEQYQGATSRNNAFIGMDLKWNFLKHFSLYGQLLLDEFVLDNVKARNGWWANKQAFQTGLKYINAFGIKNFDLQSEVNYVRPYTYSHASNYTNYTNFNQALAHPMGANFIEWIGIARLQPFKRLFLTGKLFYIKTGEDSSTALTAIDPNNNKGGNIFKSYTAVAQANTYGNAMTQGIPTTIMMLSLQVSYMLRHNFYLDLYLQYRNKTSTIASRNQNSTFVSGGIRWNIPWRLQEY